MTLEERVARELIAFGGCTDVTDFKAASANAKAYAHLIIGMCREVRPLDWTSAPGDAKHAWHHGVSYLVHRSGFVARGPGPYDYDFRAADSVEAAKAAAEAHHAERVRGMLK